MQNRLVYILGDSATGKSTAVSAMTRNLTATQKEKPFPHAEYRRKGDTTSGEIVAIKLGRWSPAGYTGADAINKNQAAGLAKWISRAPAPIVIAEGRIFAYPAFFDAVREAGATLSFVHLSASEATRKARQKIREKNTGRKVTAGSKVAAAMTVEAENLRRRYNAPSIKVDGLTPEEVGDKINGRLGLTERLNPKPVGPTKP